MKRLLLNYKDRPMDRPFTYTVDCDYGDTLTVRTNHNATYTLTRREDGTYVNEHGCEYVAVKADRRPKPFKVAYRGIDGGMETKFATLSDVQKYVKDRWLGVDYIDGPAEFHGDYGRFLLHGCTLADLGTRSGEWEWTWKTL